jgi:hypothetical protein
VEDHVSTLADVLINVPPPFALKDDSPVIQAREDARHLLKSVPAIVINEVARYFFEIYWPDKDELEGRDFPNVAPPFPEFWMEYRVPRTISAGVPRTTVPMMFGGQRVGFFWYAEDGPEPDLRWSVTSLMFVEQEGWCVGPLCSMRLGTDDLGQPVKCGARSFASHDMDILREEADFEDKTMLTLHNPALLAICFMHCSNVQLEDHRPKVSHVHKYRKLYGRAPIVYKTLNITPMQRIIKSKGGPRCGVKQALHIMRGHFKRFEEKPLFGKHKGLWWWSSQVRGTLGRGYVKKTYEVHPPEEDESES